MIQAGEDGSSGRRTWDDLQGSSDNVVPAVVITISAGQSGQDQGGSVTSRLPEIQAELRCTFGSPAWCHATKSS